MIKFFVRTTKQRQLDNSYSQVEYECLVDTNHKPVNSFIEQLKIISDYNSVLLEDDLILCKDFKNRIEKVIEENPDKIINFFTLPNKYIKTQLSNIFSYNQCTYYPKGLGIMIAKEIENILENDVKYKNCNQYDILENRALINLKLKHLIYRPCLVQHLDNGSLMNNNCSYSRMTPYFIDYLNELNISYVEARKEKNKSKLIELMKNENI